MTNSQTVLVAGAFQLLYVAAQISLEQKKPVADFPAQSWRQCAQLIFDFIG
jgi:hypothetical protein